MLSHQKRTSDDRTGTAENLHLLGGKVARDGEATSLRTRGQVVSWPEEFRGARSRPDVILSWQDYLQRYNVFQRGFEESKGSSKGHFKSSAIILHFYAIHHDKLFYCLFWRSQNLIHKNFNNIANCCQSLKTISE